MLKTIFKPHRRYLKAGTADVQKIFAMLKLIPDTEAAASRSPVALALVIDTSSSMREFADQDAFRREAERRGLSGSAVSGGDGTYQAFDIELPTKLDRAIEAAHALIDDARLSPADQLSIVHFDDAASALLPMCRLSDRTAANSAVESLRGCSGGTRLADGLRCAQQQLSGVPPELSKRVLLLTDGQTIDEPDCRPLAAQLATANAPIAAMGLGEEYNVDLMRDLAETGRGSPYHLKTISDFRTVLDEQVGASVSEVVTDLRATVAAVRGVSVDSGTRVYPSLAEISLSPHPYRLGNIPSGDYTVFVIEFSVSGISRPPSRVRLAQVGLEANVPGLRRRSELPLQDLFVEFTTNETEIAIVDEEVLGYVQQKSVDRLLQEAAHLATVDPGRARQTLLAAKGMTQRLGNHAVTKMLEEAVGELARSGTISANTRKTIALGGRTRTVKTGQPASEDGAPSEEEIRRLTGI